jgi:hypothetical protein
VLGAAYAIRHGDADGLSRFGLSMADFASLGPRAQVARLVRLMLGDDGHPDESAIRKAATQQAKRILDPQAEPPTPETAVKGFISELVLQYGLIELKDQITNNTLDARSALDRENQLRGWIQAKVRRLDLGTGPALMPTQLHQAAAQLAAQAVRILRAR